MLRMKNYVQIPRKLNWWVWLKGISNWSPTHKTFTHGTQLVWFGKINYSFLRQFFNTRLELMVCRWANDSTLYSFHVDYTVQTLHVVQ
jgi:hypothetical protein